MNIGFQVFNVDMGIYERNLATHKIKESLSEYFTYLDSETKNLSTKESVEKFLEENKDFVLNRTVKGVNNKHYTFPHKSGVLGVWASNFIAWKKFLESDLDILLIFEDDVAISKDFYQIFTKYLNQLPENWDFFSFFVPEDNYTYNRYNKNIHNIEDKDVCINYQDWSCAGYAVSKSGVLKALEDIKNIGVNRPIDWYVFNINRDEEIKFNTYSLTPESVRIVKFIDTAYNNSTIDLSENL
jgi:GR25 family glycosyltransferase involved in LPS biosynthesis